MSLGEHITKSDLYDFADFAPRNEPHLCGQGIAMPHNLTSPGAIVSVNHARQLGAQLLLVADAYERLEVLVREETP